ncbi:MAG TPA: hypothetical protein VKE88_03615 [Candidatus Nanoarchaeia archaeon]|nr:hypothetical protein [Candidatus Nanoarchaeia archaeon]
MQQTGLEYHIGNAIQSVQNASQTILSLGILGAGLLYASKVQLPVNSLATNMPSVDSLEAISTYLKAAARTGAEEVKDGLARGYNAFRNRFKEQPKHIQQQLDREVQAIALPQGSLDYARAADKTLRSLVKDEGLKVSYRKSTMSPHPQNGKPEGPRLYIKNGYASAEIESLPQGMKGLQEAVESYGAPSNTQLVQNGLRVNIFQQGMKYEGSILRVIGQLQHALGTKAVVKENGQEYHVEPITVNGRTVYDKIPVPRPERQPVKVLAPAYSS